MMLRNMFLREEGDELVLAPGIHSSWLKCGEPVAMGPIHTPFGPVNVFAEQRDGVACIRWHARWRQPPTALKVAPIGAEAVMVAPSGRGEVEMVMDAVSLN